jgi:hypothetical protein
VKGICGLLGDRLEELRSITNCGETWWRLCPNGILTWARRGVERITPAFDDDEKASITVHASIADADKKLSLFVQGMR